MLRGKFFFGVRSWKKGKIQPIFLIIILIFVILGIYITEKAKKGIPEVNYQLKIEAAQIMQQAIEVIKSHRVNKINPRYDPNFTGLIGKEFTPITTSTGNLIAKRTATNPDWAAVLVEMFMELGLKEGDIVAAGASASFPGLIIATMSAAKAMNLKLILISSIGASQWGANDPEFTWPDMEKLLFKKGIFPYRSIAISMGGDDDRGINYFGNEEQVFMSIIKRSGLQLIYEKSLTESIKKRMELYNKYTKGDHIKVFVNIGGASANVGTCEHSLKISNGLQRTLPPCNHSTKGVIFHMAERGIPVIHLLNIRTLAFKYGLPIDPIPLPKIGQSKIYQYSQVMRTGVND
ncbi:poly-gamma-glutamate system protein [Candidatus Aerophobetes bacterium]|uniref:Poly-gamma-glutamate system protein n=1 Tax=Aerophobetes bacterium TaxID=2030807 RepID=A0A662DLM9_UNCAE|nr:MAG: poly-gamma-glutamate system protein [Candidatus Aerophobetes bacterium]